MTEVQDVADDNRMTKRNEWNLPKLSLGKFG
jgi:hypothetical protein